MVVQQLINNAWYLSGAVARDLGQVSGSQAADGLFLLNALLDEQNITGRYIPYDQEIQVTSVPGQSIYLVPGLVILHELTFNLQEVRYPMRRQTRKEFFAGGRALQIDSLPYYYFFERTLGNGRIFLYFTPNLPYPLNVNGRFTLTDVTFNQDLDLTLDNFYQNYLMYALSEYMCSWYHLTFPEKNLEILHRMRKGIADLNEMDFSQTQVSTVGGMNGFNYGIVNLARSGFLPP